MKKAILSLTTMFLFLNMYSFDFNNGGNIDINLEVPQVNVNRLNNENTKDITLMVFMNAKNDLSQSNLFGLVGKWAEKDLDEMKKVGSTDRVNVVVEIGRKGKGSKRLLVLKKEGFFSSGEKVYLEDKNSDMGDYKRVIDFVNWSKKTFPAKKYILVLWNHGLGWIDPNLSNHSVGSGRSKGILFDDDTKNYVRTKQLGEILKASGYVDVVIFNACLMQMAEVVYEIKDYTSLIIGSEETMLAYGFEYDKFLSFLNSNIDFNKKQISDFFINWYKEFFKNGIDFAFLNIPLDSIAATLSAIEPSELKNLPYYLNYFASNVMNNKEEEAVKIAIAGVIRFTSIADPIKDKEKKMAPYVDLYDFARIVGENAKDKKTKESAKLLMDFIKNKLVIASVGLNKDTVNNYDYSLAGGVAINMTMKIKPVPPQFESILETKYADLSLSKDSYWDEFVKWADDLWAK